MIDHVELLQNEVITYYRNSIYRSSIYNENTGIIAFEKYACDDCDEVQLSEKYSAVYNGKMGIPVSDDGEYLLIHSAVENQGLTCYAIETGQLLWRVNKKNVYGSSFWEYQGRVIAYFKDFGFMVVHMQSGNILKEIEVQNLKTVQFNDDVIYTETINNDINVFKLNYFDELDLIKYIRPEEINIHSYKYCIITEVKMLEGKIVFYGFESNFQQQDPNFKRNHNKFVRTISYEAIVKGN